MSLFSENTMISASVTSAAGSAMRKFVRNLSFISQPCVLQAAMVVSEMNERLSPNIAPPMTDPMHSARWNPDAFATATAMGTISVIVPQDVPMAVETKHETTNRTATANRAGDMRKHEICDRFCAASAHDADEHTGCQKDQDHRHDILVADALCHDLQLVVERQRPVLQAGDEDRGQERHNDRNVVKAHLNFQTVFKQTAQTQIQDKEHSDRQQGDGTRGISSP